MRATVWMHARRAVLALAMAGLVPTVEAQRLGRLFTSAEERASLDELRYQAQFATPAPQPAPEPAAATPVEPEQGAPVVSSFTVNGIVRGSRGRGTVWINGEEIERGGVTREGIRVQTTGAGGRSVRARLPSGVDTIEIKPGQRIDVLQGVVLEPYERSEKTPEGPSAFQSGPGAAGLAPGAAVPPAGEQGGAAAGSPAAGAQSGGTGTVAAGAMGAPLDAARAEALRRALESLPAPETLTPEGRAQAEEVRRQLLEQAAGRIAPAKP